MTIRLKKPAEIAAMRQAGIAVALTLRAMRDAIVPDETTTLDLDEIAGETMKKFGARPALMGYKPSFSNVPYMHNTCISVNNEVIHGVPSAKRVLRSGDLVSLDMDAEIGGWYADATITVTVGEVSEDAKRLSQVTREALQKGIEMARPGNYMGDIGYAIQRHVEKNGMNVVREMVGHGIGRMPHEPGLDVPNYGRPRKGIRLVEGMTFCIEPMVMLGRREVMHPPGDVWTIVTQDGSWAAHWEHTVAVTKNGAVLLTAPPKDGERIPGVSESAEAAPAPAPELAVAAP
jgi:methionyl aminopeptidase